MPCRDGGRPIDEDPEEEWEEPESDDDLTLEYLMEYHKDLLEAYYDARRLKELTQDIYQKDDLARVACDAMKVVEEFALLDEVSKDTLAWHQQHKMADAERKLVKMKSIQKKRRIMLRK